MAFQGDKFSEDDFARLTGEPIGAPMPMPEPEKPVVEMPGATDPVVTPAPVIPLPGILPDPTPGDDLKDRYVSAIVKNNIAQNTGDITVGGQNTGIVNTGVMDDSVNMIGSGAGFLGRSFRDRVF